MKNMKQTENERSSSPTDQASNQTKNNTTNTTEPVQLGAAPLLGPDDWTPEVGMCEEVYMWMKELDTYTPEDRKKAMSRFMSILKTIEPDSHDIDVAHS